MSFSFTRAHGSHSDGTSNERLLQGGPFLSVHVTPRVYLTARGGAASDADTDRTDLPVRSGWGAGLGVGYDARISRAIAVGVEGRFDLSVFGDIAYRFFSLGVVFHYN